MINRADIENAIRALRSQSALMAESRQPSVRTYACSFEASANHLEKALERADRNANGQRNDSFREAIEL